MKTAETFTARKRRDVALRILNGEPPASIPIQTDEAEHVLANATEFERFGLDLDSAPTVVLVVNRAPSFVREHSWLVAGTAAFIAVQTLAIAALVFNVRRRAAPRRGWSRRHALLAMSNANLEAANRSLLAEQEERQKAEEQLRHAQKMDAIGRLAGGIAHDFNNLLTVITGYSDLRPRQLDADRPAPADVAGDPEGRATARPRSRASCSPSAASRCCSRRVIDLNAVVADIAEDAAAADRRGRRPRDRARRRRFGRSSWPTPARSQQVIVNLAVNARDAMPEGGRCASGRDRRATRRTPTRASRGRAAARTVRRARRSRDTGAGMDAADRARRSSSRSSRRSSRDKGTGLGLATVYGIVKQSGGWIWVESSPGTGATFRMYLPATRAQVTADLREQHPEPTTSAGETIMLVEDQPEVRRLAARVLRDAATTCSKRPAAKRRWRWRPRIAADCTCSSPTW